MPTMQGKVHKYDNKTINHIPINHIGSIGEISLTSLTMADLKFDEPGKEMPTYHQERTKESLETKR